MSNSPTTPEESSDDGCPCFTEARDCCGPATNPSKIEQTMNDAIEARCGKRTDVQSGMPAGNLRNPWTDHT